MTEGPANSEMDVPVIRSIACERSILLSSLAGAMTHMMEPSSGSLMSHCVSVEGVPSLSSCVGVVLGLGIITSKWRPGIWL